MRGQRTTLLGAVVSTSLLAGAAAAQPRCPPLAPPAGVVIEVFPEQSGSLAAIVSAAAAGTTVVLHDGLYAMDSGDAASRLVFRVPDVTLRSASGVRHAVVLDGGYVTGELISVRASNVTIADLTLTRAYYHPIHVSGSPGDPVYGTLVHNVRIVDPGEQAIKINPVEDGWADNGVVQCSHIELTESGRIQIRNGCYTGGIDAHAARGWIVRRNRIQGFWCDSGLSEHGIHFWRASRDTLVEDNVIADCARGIGFGLGEQGGARIYADDPYPEIVEKGHIDGIIRNNFVAAADPGLFASSFGFDTGIGLEQAPGGRLLHNSVAAAEPPASSSMEWRFAGTIAEVSNNLTTHALKARDGATATLAGNLAGVPATWFAEVARADLHLSEAGAAAVDAGVPLSPGAADFDLDGQPRDALPDVGADELADEIFADGFEGGDASAWSSTPG